MLKLVLRGQGFFHGLHDVHLTSLLLCISIAATEAFAQCDCCAAQRKHQYASCVALRWLLLHCCGVCSQLVCMFALI